MYNYKITVSYDGSRYGGWQRLEADTDILANNNSPENISANSSSTKNFPTKNNSIQGTLEAAVSRYLGAAAAITGSGRTDAGVSAVAQTANFHTASELDSENFLKNINALLPDDIVIKSVEAVPIDFHSRKNAVSKTYGYYISLDSKPDVFAAKHVYNPALPPVMYNGDLCASNSDSCRQSTCNIGNCFCQIPVNMHAMRSAADFLTGTHDFSAFTTDKTPGKSHIRTINYIDFSVIDTPAGKPILAITVNGSGFLYNMVRIIAGTLLYAGLGVIASQDIPSILRSKIRKNAGPTLPSNGLFLLEVFY